MILRARAALRLDSDNARNSLAELFSLALAVVRDTPPEHRQSLRSVMTQWRSVDPEFFSRAREVMDAWSDYRPVRHVSSHERDRTHPHEPETPTLAAEHSALVDDELEQEMRRRVRGTLRHHEVVNGVCEADLVARLKPLATAKVVERASSPLQGLVEGFLARPCALCAPGQACRHSHRQRLGAALAEAEGGPR